MASKLERHAAMLGALGHPVRLAIVRLVVQGGPSGTAAGSVQARLDVPASTLSHHLARLVEANLVKTRAEGTFRYFMPNYDTLRGLSDYLWEDCCKGGQGSGGTCC